MTWRSICGAGGRRVAFLLLAGATGLAGCNRAPAEGGRRRPQSPVTFTRDVAPIIFSRCSPCHRPGQGAPFPLLTYHDVRTRAGPIAAMTTKRQMPPWLPEPGFGSFSDERRLADDQIAI